MPSLAVSASIRFLGVALLAALSIPAGPATAQEAGSHPLDSTLEMLDLKTNPGPMPDFVTQSRGGESGQDYMPIGGKPPSRDLKPKSAGEVKALTDELDAARAAQLAGKQPKPMSAGTTAKTAAGKSPKPKSEGRQAINR